VQVRVDPVPNAVDRVPNAVDRVPNAVDRVPNAVDRVPNAVDRVPLSGLAVSGVLAPPCPDVMKIAMRRCSGRRRPAPARGPRN